jgi:hypothetical protein
MEIAREVIRASLLPVVHWYQARWQDAKFIRNYKSFCCGPSFPAGRTNWIGSADLRPELPGHFWPGPRAATRQLNIYTIFYYFIFALRALHLWVFKNKKNKSINKILIINQLIDRSINKSNNLSINQSISQNSQ